MAVSGFSKENFGGSKLVACHFKDSLHYSSPANGGRGIVRTGMLVPESVELFVCPFACGRHGSISAVKQNLKHRLSYLYVNQEDIVNGYDDFILPAVGELLETLPIRPKVILIFVSCLDDLIGTDHEALQEKLAQRYTDVRFISCHMNPISKGSKMPPAVSIQNNIYALLDKQEETDKGMNCIGSNVAISEKSEFHTFIKSLGYDKLKHISQYEQFEAYQEMGKSTFNLVISAQGRMAGEQMKDRLEIPYVFLPVSYHLEQIQKDYEALAKELGKDMDFDVIPYKIRAEQAIERALRAVKDTPVIVDASAVQRPFALAHALLEYGFFVARVQAPECMGIDQADYKWIVENHPEVEIVQSQYHTAVLREGQIPQSIAIGVDGAYLAGSKYVVDLFDDEGMYGYFAVEALMEKLEHALEKEIDLENMIHEYGLVV